jgi:DNA-directed RNA polymerase specialized sigma24 family protein
VETLRWGLWLREEQRQLVWMRAEGWRWREICARLGCDRTTAWRRWQQALARVARRLNAPGLGPPATPVRWRAKG